MPTHTGSYRLDIQYLPNSLVIEVDGTTINGTFNMRQYVPHDVSDDGLNAWAAMLANMAFGMVTSGGHGPIVGVEVDWSDSPHSHSTTDVHVRCTHISCHVGVLRVPDPAMTAGDV